MNEVLEKVVNRTDTDRDLMEMIDDYEMDFNPKLHAIRIVLSNDLSTETIEESP